MKLTQVDLENWLAHRRLTLDLTPLTLVCGPNESGKSSIPDAIGFAMTRRLPRVHAEGDRDRLIALGAKRGQVSIECEREGTRVRLTRDVTTGKVRTETPLPVPDDMVAEAVDYVLEPHGFAEATTEERLALLQKVLRVQMAPLHLKDLLQRRGFPLAAELADEGTPEDWYAQCTEMAAQARGQWKSVTGETYGEKKADTWVQEAPAAPTAEVLTTLRARLAGSKRTYENARDEHAKAAVRDEAIAEERRKQFVWQAGRKKDILARLEVVTATQTEAASVRDRLHAVIREMRDRPLICTQCGKQHVLSGNALEPIDPIPVDKIGPVASNADMENAKATYGSAKGKVDQIAILIGKIRDDLALAEEAEKKLSEETVKTTTDTAEVERLEKVLQEAQDTYSADMNALEVAQNATQVAERARVRTALAKEHHQAVKDWLALRAQVAPDGLPAELLRSALGAFNGLLRTIATTLGWQPFSVTDDMRIVRDGMDYELLSESAQWRVDATLAIALAQQSGLGFVALDRFDVLEVPARRGAMIGFYKLTKQGLIDSVLLLGTLAKPPAVPQDVAVHWLGADQMQVAA